MTNSAMAHTLRRELCSAGVEIDAIAADGGGIWCFGSRAAGCARTESDWDILVISRVSALEHRIRRGRLDLVSVSLDSLDAWASSELATHVASYGIRIDGGREIALRTVPTAAAPRKCAVTGARARMLDTFWAGLQPLQRCHEVLRLRRDVHRAWLLTRGGAIPPTALLEREWQALSVRDRAAILKCISMSPRLLRAIAQLDG